MKVLMIGDIMGEPGRRAVARLLPKLIAKHEIDVVIGNGENVAGGFGITPDLMDDLFDLGVSVITTGNHAWDKKEILEVFPRRPSRTASMSGAGSVTGAEHCGPMQT